MSTSEQHLRSLVERETTRFTELSECAQFTLANTWLNKRSDADSIFVDALCEVLPALLESWRNGTMPLALRESINQYIARCMTANHQLPAGYSL